MITKLMNERLNNIVKVGNIAEIRIDSEMECIYLTFKFKNGYGAKVTINDVQGYIVYTLLKIGKDWTDTYNCQMTENNALVLDILHTIKRYEKR